MISQKFFFTFMIGLPYHIQTFIVYIISLSKFTNWKPDRLNQIYQHHMNSKLQLNWFFGMARAKHKDFQSNKISMFWQLKPCSNWIHVHCWIKYEPFLSIKSRLTFSFARNLCQLLHSTYATAAAAATISKMNEWMYKYNLTIDLLLCLMFDMYQNSTINYIHEKRCHT